jgi:hypothetical protein
MKTKAYLYFAFLQFFFACVNNPKQKCTIREWKVIDLYRNNYPSVIDTECNNKISLINKSEIDSSFSDSVFTHLDSNKTFSLDSSGTYFVERSDSIEVQGITYPIVKVQYLRKGENVDQEFLFFVVTGKGIYIQQESKDRKLLLMNIIEDGKPKKTSDVTEKILSDTVMFPLLPYKK